MIQIPRFRLERLSRLSQRERLLVLGSALVLSIVMMDRLVLGPWWRHLQQVHQEIAQLERGALVNQQLLSRKRWILADADRYRDYLPHLKSGQLEMAELLREIEMIGRRSGISLGEIKPLTGVARGPNQEHILEIRYEGTLLEWTRFVHALEASPFLLELERATLAIKEGDPERIEGGMRVANIVAEGHYAEHTPEQDTASAETKPL